MDATAEKKESCLLDNKCLRPNIIYEAQITNNTKDEDDKILGAAETSFKKKYNNHTRDFKIYLGFEELTYNTHS